MSERVLGKFLAVILSVVFPASVFSGETAGAMLDTSSSVVVNGRTVARSTAIFAGDKVSVPSKSAATITLAGSFVVVPAGSSVAFDGDAVSLQPQSAVSIITSSGMAARIENIRIRPAHGAAHFEVARYNGRIFVASKDGALVVDGAAAENAVADGATASFHDPVPQNPGAVPATAGIGGGAIPGWAAASIGTAAVGVAAAIGNSATGAPTTPVAP